MNKRSIPKSARKLAARSGKQLVDSLLDSMKEGAEYGSLVDLMPRQMNLRDELRRAMSEIEQARQRPLLVYAANVVRAVDAPTGIDLADDLPFAELVASVDAHAQSADVLLITPGGLAQQVSQFVQRLRPRFQSISFLLPHMCFSAGTIWALSGNEIWMDERAFLGPIDPQVPGKDGRLVPAQALLRLLQRIQDTGDEALKAGQNPPWSDIQLLHSIDLKEIGNVLAASRYSIQLAASYLETHKFRDWSAHHDGSPVTAAEKKARALEIAEKLCSHEVWNVHSHGISRDVAWNELRIRIDHPETQPQLHKALRRTWALLYWAFDNTTVFKVFLSQGYSLFRNQRPVTT